MTPEHSQTAQTQPAGLSYPVAGRATGYYGLPLLKKPVWTWEIPAYFFVGGAAGSAALLGGLARWVERDERLARDAAVFAAAGGIMSPVLLILDLGRPERFLHMLRVFKPQSPMSVGVWIVLGFSSSATLAAALEVAPRRLRARPVVRRAREAASVTAALTGVGMSTYTGVLLGVTAIPLWNRHVRLLPVHFAFSSLGAAVSILQLAGHRHRALHRLGIAAAAVESAVGGMLETSGGAVDEPVRHGPTGTLMRAAGLLSGPVPLVLRLLGRRSRPLAVAAALATVAGSVLTRYAWVAAGRESVHGHGGEEGGH